MFLKRLQVPNFRALKNIDISFEPQLQPHVFPLGSQNAGGKSTLLQLIFALLHCARKPERHIIITNLFQNIAFPIGQNNLLLATFSLTTDAGKEISLSFSYCSDSFLKSIDSSDVEEISHGESDPSFSFLDKLDMAEKQVDMLENRIALSKKILDELANISSKKLNNASRTEEVVALFEGKKSYDEYIEILGIKEYLDSSFRAGLSRGYFMRWIADRSVDDLISRVRNSIEALDISLEKSKSYRALSFLGYQRTRKIIEKSEYHHILNFTPKSDNSIYSALLYSTEGDVENLIEVEELLDLVSDKIFLAMPSTQICLFTSGKSRKSLFKSSPSVRDKYSDENGTRDYYLEIDQCKEICPNLFTYDFLNIDVLVDSFRDARDEDFRAAVETGEYGHHYQSLVENLNSVLNGKTLSVESDLSGVKFSMSDGDLKTDIYPEDLSHGELKRLSIYMWLRHRKVENSIVLMDEIELALHPDWQYQIVRDLVDWGPTNQYILATHSYSLCEALTPAHVKEIPPQLLPSSSSK